MWFDLLTPNRRSRRPQGLRRTVAVASAAYLLAAAAPQVSVVVHQHAGGEHAHRHRGSSDTKDPHGLYPHHQEHHHHSEHHESDPNHHHDEHLDHPEHVAVSTATPGRHDHRRATAPSVSGRLRLGQPDPRSHWHNEAPYNLATAGLPLLVGALAGEIQPPKAEPRSPLSAPLYPTRARGPPLQRSVLTNIEI